MELAEGILVDLLLVMLLSGRVMDTCRKGSRSTGIGGDQDNNYLQDSGAVQLNRCNVAAWSQSACSKNSRADISHSVVITAAALSPGIPGRYSSAIGSHAAENSMSSTSAAFSFCKLTAW